MEVRWFTHAGRLHCIRPPRPNEPEGRIVGFCGISPAVTAGVQPFALSVDDVPDGEVCGRCMVDVGLMSAEEEPLAAALERGYVRGGITPL